MRDTVYELHPDPCVKCGGRLTTKTAGWNQIKGRPHWCYACGAAVAVRLRKADARAARIVGRRRR